MKIGADILAGRQGRHMGGIDKNRLAMEYRTFLEQRQNFLTPEYDAVLLSMDTPSRPAALDLPRVVDVQPNCGLLAGIIAVLHLERSDALMALAVDMPLFDTALGKYLQAFMAPGALAVTTEDRLRRIHPLAIIYSKATRPILVNHLADGSSRLQDTLHLLKAQPAPAKITHVPSSALSNINTPSESIALRHPYHTPCLIVVSGNKNSGKTAVLMQVILLLLAKRFTVGAIKHDAHAFTPDAPGIESFRPQQAGAEVGTVYSQHRYLLPSNWSEENLATLLPHFQHLDIILLEDGKNMPLPTSKFIRTPTEGLSPCAPETLLVACRNCNVRLPGIPSLELETYADTATILAQYPRERKRDA